MILIVSKNFLMNKTNPLAKVELARLNLPANGTATPRPSKADALRRQKVNYFIKIKELETSRVLIQ